MSARSRGISMDISSYKIQCKQASDELLLDSLSYDPVTETYGSRTDFGIIFELQDSSGTPHPTVPIIWGNLKDGIVEPYSLVFLNDNRQFGTIIVNDEHIRLLTNYRSPERLIFYGAEVSFIDLLHDKVKIGCKTGATFSVGYDELGDILHTQGGLSKILDSFFYYDFQIKGHNE